MILLSQFPKLERAFYVSIIIILILLCTLFGVQSCIKTKQATKAQNELATKIYNDSMPAIQQRLKDSSLIVTQTQLLATKDAEIVKHIEKENGLLKLASNVQIKTVVQVVEKLVPYKDSVPKLLTIVDSVKNDSVDYLALPSRYVEVDSDFQLDATVLKTGLEINYLKIPNTTTINIGETGNIFHHKSVVKIHQSNKYIEQIDTKNVIVVDPKDKSKPWKTFGIGFGTGSAVAIVAGILTHIYIH